MGCGQTMKVRQWDIATAIDGKKNGEWVHVKKNKRKESASELFGVRRAIKRIVHRVNYIFKRIRDMCTTWYFSKVQFIFIFCDYSVCKTRFVFLWFLICVDSGWLHLYYLSHMIVFALVFCVLRSFCNSIFLALLYLLWRSAVPRLVAVHLYCLSRMTALRIHKNFEI